jgi:hypothetical protein
MRPSWARCSDTPGRKTRLSASRFENSRHSLRDGPAVMSPPEDEVVEDVVVVTGAVVVVVV